MKNYIAIPVLVLLSLIVFGCDEDSACLGAKGEEVACEPNFTGYDITGTDDIFLYNSETDPNFTFEYNDGRVSEILSFTLKGDEIICDKSPREPADSKELIHAQKLEIVK